MNAILLLPLLAVVMLFFMQRKQKAEAAKVAAMQAALAVGDRVVTTSGMYGTIVDVDDTTVDLEIAEEVVTTWLRQAVREVQVEETETESETETLTDAVEHKPLDEA